MCTEQVHGVKWTMRAPEINVDIVNSRTEVAYSLNQLYILSHRVLKVSVLRGCYGERFIFHATVAMRCVSWT